jgi:hypothetical protein
VLHVQLFVPGPVIAHVAFGEQPPLFVAQGSANAPSGPPAAASDSGIAASSAPPVLASPASPVLASPASPPLA